MAQHKDVLLSLDFDFGSDFQVGTLRFCGSTEFSGGLWAGVELDKAEGKNDGSVAGVQYFTCRMKHGKDAAPHGSSTSTDPPSITPPHRLDET